MSEEIDIVLRPSGESRITLRLLRRADFKWLESAKNRLESSCLNINTEKLRANFEAYPGGQFAIERGTQMVGVASTIRSDETIDLLAQPYAHRTGAELPWNLASGSEGDHLWLANALWDPAMAARDEFWDSCLKTAVLELMQRTGLDRAVVPIYGEVPSCWQSMMSIEAYLQQAWDDTIKAPLLSHAFSLKFRPAGYTALESPNEFIAYLYRDNA